MAHEAHLRKTGGRQSRRNEADTQTRSSLCHGASSTSSQERRAFLGCDMNTSAGSALWRLVALWQNRVSAVGGLVAMADVVPGVKHTRARVWLRRPADGCLVAAVLAF